MIVMTKMHLSMFFSGVYGGLGRGGAFKFRVAVGRDTAGFELRSVFLFGRDCQLSLRSKRPSTSKWLRSDFFRILATRKFGRTQNLKDAVPPPPPPPLEILSNASV